MSYPPLLACFSSALLVGTSLLLSPVFGAPYDFAENTPGDADGANHTHYNRGGQLAWRNPDGDWRDADGVRQGTKPFATAKIAVKPEPQSIEMDVTSLVRDWVSGKMPPKGVLLRNTSASGQFHFHSREVSDPALRPKLVITMDGKAHTAEAAADTCLNRSTYRPQGNLEVLKISGTLPALIRFDLAAFPKTAVIERAVLRLVSDKQYAAGEIGVFACDQGEDVAAMDPIAGLAAKYPGDRGISGDPGVLFATGFESPEWKKEWTQSAGAVETMDADPDNQFEPLDGKACRGHLAKGALTAMNMTYEFGQKNGAEPEEVYFRYYLRFGDNWRQTVQGGKMPGLSGTYGKAGWGGRKVNGRDGWSARGSFGLTLPEGNPLAGLQPLGFYCYHAGMKGTYGDIWVWNQGYRGYLENNRWYCVEQFVKMNTPGGDGAEGASDGVLRVWIDGRPAFEKSNIRFRDVDTLKVEQIWINVYHGGTVPSPKDQHLYIDNIVAAKHYIGPMGAVKRGK